MKTINKATVLRKMTEHYFKYCNSPLVSLDLYLKANFAQVIKNIKNRRKYLKEYGKLSCFDPESNEAI